MSETCITGDEIFVVDDDLMVSDLLYMTFRLEGYRVATFNDGEAFSATARFRSPKCILLDVFMPGKSGLDILKDIDAHNYPAPIIVMSGKASIPIAVEAVKNGAFDIIEKPFSLDTIVGRARQAIDLWVRTHASAANSEAQSAPLQAYERLTQREAQVLAEITAAASNKEAGEHLGISPRTIEVHRSRIMMKLGAKNTADLMRIVLSRRPSAQSCARGATSAPPVERLSA